MANRHLKTKSITLASQKIRITQTYGNVEKCIIKNSMLTCILNICPSTESDSYKIKVSYTAKKNPIAILLSPKLQLHDGNRPPHLYGNDKSGHPILCIYYPRFNEWNSTMFLADSFVPWISTWLNAYEYWLITGKWHYLESPHRLKTDLI